MEMDPLERLAYTQVVNNEYLPVTEEVPQEVHKILALRLFITAINRHFQAHRERLVNACEQAAAEEGTPTVTCDEIERRLDELDRTTLSFERALPRPDVFGTAGGERLEGIE